MRIYLLAGALMASMAFASCSQNDKETSTVAPKKTATPQPTTATPEPPKVLFTQDSLKQLKPMQFLDLLKQHLPDDFVAVEKAPINWVTRKDVDQLMALVDSKEPCAGVVYNKSAIMPHKNVRSTVGIEALMMIEGYRKKEYPAYNSSLEYGKSMQMDQQTHKLVLFPGSQFVQEARDWYKTQH